MTNPQWLREVLATIGFFWSAVEPIYCRICFGVEAASGLCTNCAPAWEQAKPRKTYIVRPSALYAKDRTSYVYADGVRLPYHVHDSMIMAVALLDGRWVPWIVPTNVDPMVDLVLGWKVDWAWVRPLDITPQICDAVRYLLQRRHRCV